MDKEIETILNRRRTTEYFQKDNVYRLIHGAADGFQGWFVDRFGNFLLSTSESSKPGSAQIQILEKLAAKLECQGIYHKSWKKSVRGSATTEASPVHIGGNTAPEEFEVIENGLKFGVRFAEGYSVGLFHDQRHNRLRLLQNEVTQRFRINDNPQEPMEVLNTFAYTCAFSVCATSCGHRTTSLDWSRKYLDWGRGNLLRNGLDPELADFIYGDAREWMKRLERKGRRFDFIILDPPSFSQVAKGKSFQVRKDYSELIQLSTRLLKPRGVILACANLKSLKDSEFIKWIQLGVSREKGNIEKFFQAPQPEDFPEHPSQPAHLKSVWMKVLKPL